MGCATYLANRCSEICLCDLSGMHVFHHLTFKETWLCLILVCMTCLSVVYLMSMLYHLIFEWKLVECNPCLVTCDDPFLSKFVLSGWFFFRLRLHYYRCYWAELNWDEWKRSEEPEIFDAKKNSSLAEECLNLVEQR